MNKILKFNKFDSLDNWEIDINGKELNYIKKNLSMSESEKNKTIISAAKILSNCPNPNGKPKRKVGLAIGKVQSGKTSNYISLIGLAFDNNYRIIIVFGGSTKILMNQTNDRIIKSLDINNREDFQVVNLDSLTKFSKYDRDNIEAFYNSGKKIIIVGLKNYTHITRITDLLKSSGLDDKPTLIIDDEGDQMSLNGAVKKNGKETSTYREFVNLFKVLNFSTFISVTATPQANLMISTLDMLSPDFFELIEPGELYSGSNVFHNKINSKYISIISDKENIIMDEESTKTPESFVKALSCFYVAGAIRMLRNDKSVNSMLIHPSRKKFNHEIVNEKVNLYITSIKNCINNKNDSMIESFIKLGYYEIMKTANDNYSLESIVNIVKEQIPNSIVFVLNGDMNENINYNKARNNIIIGGTMVERGLTIKNLTTTYIIRSNKKIENADTVEQRARWFGYKISNGIDYLDVCRIFMTENIAKNFYDLKIHEDDIWNKIRTSKINNIPAKEMKRFFELDEHFNPTRSSVISNFNSLSLNKWTIQKKLIDINEIESNIIKNTINNLLKEYKYEDIIYKSNDGNIINRVYNNVDMNEFYRKIISKYYTYQETGFDVSYYLTILDLLKSLSKSEKMDVLVKRYGSYESRNISDKKISYLMQGPNKNDNTGSSYPGDLKLHNNRIQLQIHYIKNKNINNNIFYPTFAFFCPEIEHFSRIVGVNND